MRLPVYPKGLLASPLFYPRQGLIVPAPEPEVTPIEVLGWSGQSRTTTGAGPFNATHTPTAGADAVLLVCTSRGNGSTTPHGWTVTYGGVAVPELFSSFAQTPDHGTDDILVWTGVALAPPNAANAVAFTTVGGVSVKGVYIDMISLQHVTEDYVLGDTAYQKFAGAATDTVTLGITPEATGSLLLAVLGQQQATTPTLSSFSGTGWTEQHGGATGAGSLTYKTTRTKVVTALGAETVGATFNAADLDTGGILIELRP